MLIYGVGFLDSVGFIQYFANIDQIYFYLVFIFIKIVMLMVSQWDLRSTVASIPLIGTILFGLFVSSALNPVDFVDVARVIVAAMSIILTIVIIDGDFRKYSIGLAANGFLICILYIMQVTSGQIVEINDRLYFFNGSHPNLGGEILSLIVILSTASLRPLPFFTLFSLSSYCCWLMQSRTSILAMIIAAAAYGISWIFVKFGKQKAVYVISIILFVLFSVLAIEASTGSDRPQRIFDFLSNSVFLVEDSYRGANSGVSGRDMHWYQTLEIIDENFFAGAGVEYPRRLDILQPHNWFLYPVALFGLFGYFIIAAMLHALIKVSYSNKNELVRIIPIFVLLMLNDRFMNLNISPLGIYVYLFARMYKPMPLNFANQRSIIRRGKRL